MKILRIILSLMAVVAISSSFSVTHRDAGGKSIEKLWEEYAKAERQDQIRRMADILTEIKAEARAKRRSWDYFKAAEKYVDVSSRRNWKLRDSLQSQLEKDIYEYDEPLLGYLLKRRSLPYDELCEEVRKNEARLRSAGNEEIYIARDCSYSLPVANDYEYALWDMFRSVLYGRSDALADAYLRLKDEIGNAEPQAGMAEYQYVMHSGTDKERKDALEGMLERYGGSAMGLLPAMSLLEMEFYENQDKGSQEYFLDLRKRLESYERERNMYRKGVDKMIAQMCHGFEFLMSQLDAKAVLVAVRDGKADLALRNIDAVKVSVCREGKTVFEAELDNPVRSYHVFDTLHLELPVLDDGDYTLKCFSGSREIGECRYPKFTLSAAIRADRDDWGIYVADYKSGMPLDQVDVQLYKGDRKIAEKEGLRLDGFTALPDDIASMLNADSGYHIVCQTVSEDGKLRRSQDVYVKGGSDFEEVTLPSRFAEVMLDRAAFRPGETLRFKAVIYEKAADGAMETVREGEVVSVWMQDSRGEVLAEQEMKVNDYGSLAGEFVLGDIRRQGHHRIVVYSEGRSLGLCDFVVDEFQLPAFEVVFEENEDPFLPGDTIVVKGQVRSFSGHSLASSKVAALVKAGDLLVMEEDVAIDEDGSFSLAFTDTFDDDKYNIEVRVTDLTGETHSFFCDQYVMRNPGLGVALTNAAAGRYRMVSENQPFHVILAEDKALVKFNIHYLGRMRFNGHPVRYRVCRGQETVAEGEALSGDVAEIDFSGLGAGLYSLEAEFLITDAGGNELEGSKSVQILKLDGCGEVLGEEFENVFCELEDCIGYRFGVGNGPVWAVVELFGDKGQLLESELITVAAGEIRDIRYEHTSEYPDAIEMKILYFRDSQCFTYSHIWRRPVKENNLPLEIVRMDDSAAPDSECSVVIRTEPDTEVLAAVFDLATERIRKNEWRRISAGQHPMSSVRINAASGRNGNGISLMMDDTQGDMVIGYGSARRANSRNKSAAAAGTLPIADMAVTEEAIPFQLAVDESAQVTVREDFAVSLAFEPFLRSSADGTVSLEFNTSDKISTFVVSVFAHNRNMDNSVMRRDILVTLPVKVSVTEPLYLYSGDEYVLRASVSNVSSSPVEGLVRLEVYSAGDHEGELQLYDAAIPVNVPAGDAVPVSFDIPVPADVEALTFKLVFSGEGVSDGVSLNVPVRPASQMLEEVHSAVLLPGMSEDEVMESLRRKFVNVSSVGASYSEISVIGMLREALPLVNEDGGKNAVSLSEAIYVNLLTCGLRKEEGDGAGPYMKAAYDDVGRLLACANSDGGFGWFDGMKSSPVVTAVVLERFAGLRDRGLLNVMSYKFGEDALDDLDEAVVSAVKYLDSVYFSDPDRPSWYGCISMWQYMNVRSMYAGIPFDKQKAREAMGVKEYKEFRKAVKDCLLPKKSERWTDGAILRKVQMIRILNSLASSEEGLALAESWGAGSGARTRMRRSMAVELESLKEYAVGHPSGGLYYPNAVLPFRGLLESEAYAHSMICNLFRDLSSDQEFGKGLAEMADGICVWMMLQKESQQWSSDPGFVDAMASVYDASDAVKQTRIAVLSKRYGKPFEDIKASGNGFRVSVSYYKENGSETGKVSRVELADGDTLCLGDKIVAVYSLWSEENRSFVRLSVPRAACFRPHDQLSGWSGGWLRQLSYGSFNISPYAYREVKADRTLYWMDVFPDETSVIEEVLFVTQEGRFASPVAEIESIYAPHYRANDVWDGVVRTVR